MAVLMRALLALCTVIATAAVISASPQATPAPAATADLIQRHYDSVGSFTADFVHTFRGGLLPQVTTERGRVKIKKPGRMRWTYDAPHEKEFVADGRQLYSYVKADRTCYVNDLPADDRASTAALFLAGKGNLVRDFKAAAAPSLFPTEIRVQLTPTSPQTEFTQLTIGVDSRTYALMSMETTDADGGVSTFRFTNLRENASLPDRDFVFTPPKGVDVIR